MKLKTTAALVAALVGIAGLAATTAHAETRVAQTIRLADACISPGAHASTFVPLPSCSPAQRDEVVSLISDMAILLSVVTVNDKMTSDAIRDCTASFSEVKAMTACLQTKSDAMTWMTATMPTMNFEQQLIFGSCALDNGKAATAEIDLVATVACYKANAA